MWSKPPKRSRPAFVLLPHWHRLLRHFAIMSAKQTTSDHAELPYDGTETGLLVTGLDAQSADTATSAWLTDIGFFRVESKATGGGDAYVDLLQYGDDFPVSRHVEFYTKTLDTCEIRNNDGGGGDGGTFLGFPVVCDVVDDGTLDMPANIIDAFTDTTSNIEVPFERVIERLDFINNIAFRQRSIVAD